MMAVRELVNGNIHSKLPPLFGPDVAQTAQGKVSLPKKVFGRPISVWIT